MKKILFVLLFFWSFLAIASPIIFDDAFRVAQESSTNPNTPKNAHGEGHFVFNPADNTLAFSVSFSGLSSAPTMAHFHSASAGSNGPVIQTICGAPAPTLLGQCPAKKSGKFLGTWHLSGDQVQLLQNRGVYINIHTNLNPKGEIRAQLTP